jgi:UDP-3-O-[3-hydroxymyristoyl] N-acetylglucosamine deacetylase/3-hydroxyacyl-[acyl-carrier-protein] dehydratase
MTFIRTDLPGRPEIPVAIQCVAQRQRRTTLEAGDARVEMVEHVLAALAGLRIDNCTIEIDAPETPGCDGSSEAFTRALLDAGIEEQPAIRQSFIVDRPYFVQEGDAMLAIHPPMNGGLFISYNLDYGPQTPMLRQSYFADISPDAFVNELSDSRTFLLQAEAEMLQAQGIGTRTSPRDLLIFGADGPVDNALRHPEEPARHKILDIIGDLSIFGRDLWGHVVAYKSGHRLNAELVRQLTESVQAMETKTPSATVYDIRRISNLLPHRYPFLLVDRVTELEHGRRGVGIKNVTINEPFFQGHWPGRPVMPGVMIVEAMAQMAGLVFADDRTEKQQYAMLLALDNVKLRRPVMPGDQLVLEAEAIRVKLRTAHIRCRALVDSQVAAEADLRFVRMDADAA